MRHTPHHKHVFRHLAAGLLAVLLLLAQGPETVAQDSGDVHEHGTTVNGDPIDVGEATPKSSSVIVGSKAITPGSPGAAINSINTRINLFEENCLFTFAQVDVVDADGNAILGLTENDFDIFEDAGFGPTAPQDKFVIPPQGTTTRQADIIFAVDNSGSMGDEIAAIKANLASFVSALQASGIDAQLGLVRYGSSDAFGGAPIITNGGALVSDPIFFRDNVFSQNDISGFIEPMYDAIVQGLQSFNFRPDAQTIVIGVTDENFNQGSNTEADALTALQNNNATFFGLVPVSSFGTGSIEGQALNLATPTSGSVFSITSSFNTILGTIVQQVSGTYLVGYTPSDPFTVPPSARSVEITANTSLGSLPATGTYTPGARSAVRRAAATEALTTAAAGQPLTLQAETVDLLSPGISTATLFYRTTGSTTYQSTPLADVGGGVFEATVPAGAVQAPGLDYYFLVSDGSATVTAPGSDPQARPFQIGVTNSAPSIASTLPASLTSGSAIPISAEVTDDGSLANVDLFYRQQGRLGFTQASMSQSGSTFSASIPGSVVTNQGVDYYIAAVDDDGVTRTLGTPDLPVVLGGCVPLEVADGTPPACGNIELEFDGPDGALSAVLSSASDPESGIASATFTDLRNLTGRLNGTGAFEEGDSQSFDPATTTSISIRGDRISYSKGGGIVVTVENGAGLASDCDPVVEQLSSTIPTGFALGGNYPNPVEAGTRIEFQIAEPGPVRLEVFDLLGRRVATLVDQEMGSGTYEVEWSEAETARLSAGTYIYRLQAGSFTATERLTIVR